MEIIKDITTRAKENGLSVKEMDTSFAEDFHKYMKESYRKSKSYSVKSGSSNIIYR